MFNEADKTVLLLGENSKLQQDDIIYIVYIFIGVMWWYQWHLANKVKLAESFVNLYMICNPVNLYSSKKPL